MVQKTYLEYSSLETYNPRLYDDATNAMNYWRGDSSQRWGVNLIRVRSLCESLRESFEYYSNNNDVSEELERISKLETLYNDIQRCETFDDLLALGPRMESINAGDYDIYDSGYIEINPELGIFHWEVNYSTDETYAYHSRMFDIAVMSLSD